nr:hypothetical protein KPHV_83940 [Kitasatospora purpeofusca]
MRHPPRLTALLGGAFLTLTGTLSVPAGAGPGHRGVVRLLRGLLHRQPAGRRLPGLRRRHQQRGNRRWLAPRLRLHPRPAPHPGLGRTSSRSGSGVTATAASARAGWRDGGTCPGIGYEVARTQDLVDAVRATGPRNVVLVPGIACANDLSGRLAHAPADPAHQPAAV